VEIHNRQNKGSTQNYTFSMQMEMRNIT